MYLSGSNENISNAGYRRPIMKKAVCIILFSVLIISHSFAQEKKIYTFSIKANPFAYLASTLSYINFATTKNYPSYIGLYELEFQYALNDYLNISFNPRLESENSPRYLYNEYYSINHCLHLTPGLLFRPLKTRLRGWYLGAYIPIGWINMKEGMISKPPTVSDNFALLGIGIATGCQWINKKGGTFSLGVGGQKYWKFGFPNNTYTYTYTEPFTLKTFLTSLVERNIYWELPLALTMDFRFGYSF